MTLFRKKPKRRYLILAAVSAVMIAAYLIYLLCVGGRYSFVIPSLGAIDPDSVTVETSDDVVRVTDIRQEPTHDNILSILVVETERVHSGKTTLTVRYHEDLSEFLGSLPESGEEINPDDTDALLSEDTEKQVELYVPVIGAVYDITNDSFTGLWAMLVLLIALAAAVIVTLFFSFREKRKTGSFSYAMVAQGGVMLFLAVSVCIEATLILYVNRDYLLLMRFSDLLSVLTESGKSFILLTLLPVLLFALALCISNIRLVRHEGFRPQNLLGFLLGFGVIGGMVLMYWLGKAVTYSSESEFARFLLTVIHTECSFIFCYFECMLFSTVVCAVQATRYRIREPMDYLMILGCAIRSDGTPTPLLRARIDRAIAFDREQNTAFGKKAKFVPSGGQGSDEVVSEAECMKRYLMEQGVEEERILKEDRSVNTYQNMAFSKKVIEDDAADLSGVNVAFSTTNYHVFRGYTLADEIGMKVKGLSAKTKLYFYPNAFLREFIGLLWNQKVRHLIFVGVSTLILTVVYLIVRY